MKHRNINPNLPTFLLVHNNYVFYHVVSQIKRDKVGYIFLPIERIETSGE